MAAPPSLKRETDKAELSHREKLTMHADRSLENIACVLLAQTKDAKIMCVIRCQKTRTQMHTFPKRLASARHSKVKSRSYLFYSRFDASNKPVIEDEEEDDVFSRRPFILWFAPVVTS